jgi:arsenical pump membrane protein
VSLAIFIITSLLLILSIIFKPKIWKIDTYYLVALLGALAMIVFMQITPKEIYNSLFKNPLISPIKILVLFITMTFLSIVCDNLGFFNYLAYKAVRICKNNQYILFTILYLLISLVTIFTSNDIIILTFTPFIIYFTKRSGIKPIPYLVMEFTAANTASMMLLVGNPTNILLSLSNNISFMEYLKNMWLPTLITSISLYLLLILIFHKSLSDTIVVNLNEEAPKLNKLPVIISLIHLILSTVLLAISNYIDIEMYLITLTLSITLLIFLGLYILITKKEKNLLYHSFKRLPYSLIPFLISMFILVEALNINGYTEKLFNLLSKMNTTYSYGISSYLMCNVMNNIPMSVLYSNVLSYGSSAKVIYATIIGSNLGAYLTPLGALAGIMWLSILKLYDVDFNFKTFIKYGVILSIPLIIIAITILFLI